MNPRSGTLIDAIRTTASEGGQDFVFYLDRETVQVGTAHTLAEAERRAGLLLERGIEPGEPVGVLGPNSPEWIFWAVGIWMAGGVLAPIPYPLRIRDPAVFGLQTAQMTKAVGCRLVASEPKFVPMLPEGLAIAWGVRTPSRSLEERPRDPGDPAVIQFTSGSTAVPKAAVLTHRAIVAATTTFYQHMRLDPEQDPGISWLPFFHDNGLFGSVVLPLVYRGTAHVLPTERFAKNPSSWFRVASEARATNTSGPSSAWGMALRFALRRPDGIDLGSLRAAFIAAETIEPGVVERLVQDGPSLGLDPSALAGAYGMAETTLGLTIARPWHGITIDTVDLDQLASAGRAIPATGGRVKRVASCGVPLPEVELRIAGPGGDVSEREVGEILARAPSMMLGYIGPDAPDPFEDGWLRTGDLGYMADGELFVTGRIKEIIISYGRNYNPDDIEWAAGRVSEIRPGRVVAFAEGGDSEGKLIVAFEPLQEDRLDGLLVRIRQTVADVTGLMPKAVVALPRGSIMRTTSGKLQRTRMRERWSRGELREIALAIEPLNETGGDPS